MTMPWGLVGPAFDYPTPYALENRLLLLRGSGLLLLALVLALLVSFRPEPASGAAAALLGSDTVLGSPWPMSLAAALFAVLGVVNIVRASGQRRLLLEPGQPASLTGELLREAQGASPGAAWLQRALVNGAPEPLAVDGPWRGLLLRLAPELGHWPRPLHQWLARRVYHALLCAGVFGLLAPVWLLADGVAAALAALGLGAIVVGVVGASALFPGRAVGGGLALGLWWLLGLLVALAAVFASPLLPGQALLKALVPLALPEALVSLLWGLLLVEGLALLAGRAQLGPVLPGRVDSHEAELNPDAELRGFVKELDLELHRRWAEGVPNRRHAWQMPGIEAGERGRFQGVVLEESHPLLPPGARERPLAWPRRGTPEMWLAVLGLLCLVWTLMGGAFWAWQGWTQLRDAGVYWTKAGVGLALVVAAGHALRVSHLLWSRFEVESTVLWLELQGQWSRVAGTAEAATVHQHSAKVAVAQARSVFYAAAEHRVGSRTLRGLRGDDAAARQWLQTLQQLSQTLAQALPDAAERRRVRETATALRAAALAAQSTLPAAAAAAAAAPAARPARFCTVCGQAVLAGGRFCQHCGSALPQG